MIYSAFALAMIASSIATLSLYAIVDHRHGLDFATVRLGCAVSLLEATSGVLSIAALKHIGVPVFGTTFAATIDICVIASILAITVVFVTRDQLMEHITNA